MSPIKPLIKAVYTDGACSGNPGPGGWAAVIYFEEGTVWELGGAAVQTTNNRMELQGAIAALSFLDDRDYLEPATLYTDSKYVIQGITSWIRGWKRKGWKTAAGKAVLNQDLWEQLDRLNTSHINWQYVAGHSGNEGNERCDTLARAFAAGRSPQLRQDTPGDLASSTLSLKISSKNSPASPTKPVGLEETMVSTMTDIDFQEVLPRSVRVDSLRDLIETLRIADEAAEKGYFITSSELADLMDVNASAVTSRGDNWVWRNWIVTRVRREGNQILWQLERVEL